jgi:NADH-quinone oxidoreductase subunit J
MEFTTVLFYVFAAVMLLAALRVITAKNPVHAALFLVLTFFNAAGIWLLLKAEFLAIVLVLVYVGAVMVLFLFVVMMIDIDTTRVRAGFWGYLPMAAFVGALIVLEMAAVLWHGYADFAQSPAASAYHVGGTKELGRLIYTQYIYGFEIAAVILLVAMIAAVALTLRKRKDTKAFDPGLAVKVKRNDRLRIVKMDAVNQRAIDEAAVQAAAAKEAASKEAP